jgi:hypothetical protein
MNETYKRLDFCLKLNLGKDKNYRFDNLEIYQVS